MNGSNKGGRRPVIYWATCPECFTYIWVAESSLVNEESISCPYCDSSISLAGGARLSESCNQLQALLEDIERQVSMLPTAIDVHRFISEQVGHIANAFNDRLDEIQESKDNSQDLQCSELKTKKLS
jgi:DNA-directed RNA polymerase subunit RPC12/RpoP